MKMPTKSFIMHNMAVMHMDLSGEIIDQIMLNCNIMTKKKAKRFMLI